ncbi:MAG: hypothetical protein K5905_00850 [Roseibium sp.]|uniref:hypothetical protein n=1 Tax=Roseibium sp. TaxID=1936156 RepID=UPI002626D2A0|nr:hypothetical protein [Roseibium sp.]MCV0423995.1 hypothetical protein [Roseibium sp.]
MSTLEERLASIHPNPDEQEAFIVVKSADSDLSQDVQIKLRPDRIILRRDAAMHWQGVQIEADAITMTQTPTGEPMYWHFPKIGCS